MGERIKINTLQDFFFEAEKRPRRGACFERLCGYDRETRAFLGRYYEAAVKCGLVIDGGLQNPDNQQYAYYAEILGSDYRTERSMILSHLRRWLPRLNEKNRDELATAIFEALDGLRREGKNESALKNVYIKFMCWLYYKAEPLFQELKGQQIPKILYSGTLTRHGLLFLNILADCGCDVLLLQCQGEEAYSRLDPESVLSHRFRVPDEQCFPTGFSLSEIREELQARQQQERVLGEPPRFRPATNIWLSGNPLQDIMIKPELRGDDSKCFYNAFCRMRGVENKISYESELYKFQMGLKNEGRKMLVIDDVIPTPSMDEISAIKRDNYRDVLQLAQGLAPNIRFGGKRELEQLLRRAFVELLLEEGKRDGVVLGRLTTEAVYLLCWLKRYEKDLFSGWEMPDVGCFIYLGGCRSESEALFCRFLAKTPTDVLILNPDLNRACCLADNLLYEKNYEKSLRLTKFPQEESGLRLGTTAYHAERDLDSIMYGDTGMYRNRQFGKASVITLRTMYEEIPVLWDQELKYRPNFSAHKDHVNIPVIFAKVSGVKERDLTGYWRSVKALITPETVLISSFPHFTTPADAAFNTAVRQMVQDGKLRKDYIKTSSSYRYGMLKESVQDHILDAIQSLISQNLIRGGSERQKEYRILSVLLTLDKDLLRLIQNFDFTKKNPKVVGVVTGETVLSTEDAVVLAFLNLVGFDVILFVPTGYQCVEQHYTKQLLDEHQIGEYMYDLSVPDFSAMSAAPMKKLKDILFRRGN